jgi:hypothetical protein
MTNSEIRKWIPGLIFLSAQIVNNIYELKKDTRTLSWSPHTTQVHYHISAYKNGLAVPKDAVEARYGIRATEWEVHAAGNLKRLVETAEARHKNNPDSVLIRYSINNHPTQTYLWLQNRIKNEGSQSFLPTQ